MTMKLCRDCKHGRDDVFHILCTHPAAQKAHFAPREFRTAFIVRYHNGECGPDGRLFEPKPPKLPAVRGMVARVRRLLGLS